MPLSATRPKPYWLLVLALFLLQAGVHIYILTKGRYSIPYGDEASFFMQLYNLAYTWDHSGSLWKVICMAFHYERKPPVFFLTALPFYYISKNLFTSIHVNLVYWAVLLFSMYGLAKRLHGPVAGLFCAFLISVFPGIQSCSRFLMLEFALASWVALSMFSTTWDIGKTRNSVGVGLILGTGVLIKHSFWIFMLPAIIFYILLHRRSIRLLYRSLAIIAGLVILCAAPYYIRDAVKGYFNNALLEVHADSSFSYMQSLFQGELQPFIAILAVTALLGELFKKNYFWPFAAILILSTFELHPNKSTRFLYPLFPIIALMATNFLWTLRRGKKIIVPTVVCSGLFLCVYNCFGLSTDIDRRFERLGFINPDRVRLADGGDWIGMAESIIRVIKNKSNETPLILFVDQRNNDTVGTALQVTFPALSGHDRPNEQLRSRGLPTILYTTSPDSYKTLSQDCFHRFNWALKITNSPCVSEAKILHPAGTASRLLYYVDSVPAPDKYNVCIYYEEQ